MCVFQGIQSPRACLWLCWPNQMRLSGIWDEPPLTTHTEHLAQLCSRLDMKQQLKWKPTCFSLAFLISKSRARCIVRNCTQQQPLYLIWEQTMFFPDLVSYHHHPELPLEQGVRAGLPWRKTGEKTPRILQQLTAAWLRGGPKELLIVGRERMSC